MTDPTPPDGYPPPPPGGYPPPPPGGYPPAPQYGAYPPAPPPGAYPSQQPGASGPYGAPMPPAQFGYAQQPPPVGPPPPPVKTAVLLMYISAVLSAAGILAALGMRNKLRTILENSHANYSTQQLDNAVNAGIAVTVVFGVIFIVLYILLALQVRKGRNWARIVTWVIAGLAVLGGLSAFSQSATGAVKALDVVHALLAIAIIVLLARGVVNDYFRRAGQARAHR